MKKLFVGLLLSTLTFNAIAANKVPESNYMKFDIIQRSESSAWSNRLVIHYCHMETVYVQKKIDNNATTMAIVWNLDESSPLRCDDYAEYFAKLAKKQIEKNIK